MGTSYNSGIFVSGGAGGNTFTLVSGAFPPGLTIAGLFISGVPSTAGSYSLTFRITDSVGASGQSSCTYVITNPPVISCQPGRFADQGLLFSSVFPVSQGASGARSLSLTGGSLPTGLGLTSTTGALNGTTTASIGNYSFTVRVIDQAGASSSAVCWVAVFAFPSVSCPPANTTSLTATYLSSFSLVGGAPLSTAPFLVAGSILPAGLSFSSTLNPGSAVISGTPTSVGFFSFQLQVQDSAGALVLSPSCSVTVLSGPSIVCPVGVATVGVAYNSGVSVTGGVGGALSFSLTSGALPDGLASQFPSSGSITGLPNLIGVFSFVVRVVDGINASASLSCSISVTPPPTVSCPPQFFADVGVSFSSQAPSGNEFSFVKKEFFFFQRGSTKGAGASGGRSFSFSSGDLSALGLVLTASSGLLSGTPPASAVGSFVTYVLRVQDSAGATAFSPLCNVTVFAAAVVSCPAATSGVVAAPFSSAFGISGGAPVVSFTLLSGSSLPPGLSFNSSSRTISGFPTATGFYSFQAQLQDAAFATVVSPSCSISISSAPVVSCPLGFSIVGVPYSSSFTATGGSSTGYVFSITSGSLPSGLTFTPGGIVSGTPGSIQLSTFTVSVTDSVGSTASRVCTIDISNTLTVQCPTAVVADTELAYSFSVVTSVPAAGRTFVLVSGLGVLPTNLTLDPTTGVISGTPTATGTFSFSIFVSNGVASATSTSCTISVFAFPTVTCPAETNGEVTVFFSQSFAIAGGSSPLSLSLSASSSLPFGLTFNASSGTLSGTPLNEGSFSYGLTLADAAGALVSSSTCSLTIVGAPTVGCCAVSEIAQNASLSCSAIATGGSNVFVNWTIVSGVLPSGFSLNATTGLFSGASNASPAAFNYAVQVFDSAGGYGTSNCQISIVSPPSLLCPSVIAGVGRSYISSLVVASGGSTTFSNRLFVVSSLPVGLSLDASSGLITGLPTVVGSVAFSANVTDASGGVGTVSCVISVSADPVLSCPTQTVVDVGAPYSSSFGISGGTDFFSLSLVGGTLPAGLSLNASSGLISGVTSGPETQDFSVILVDSLDRSSASVSCRISSVVSVNVTLWPRSCRSVTGAGVDWSGSNNLATASMPSSVVDFMLSSSLIVNSSASSNVLLCESFCADQLIPSDAFLSGISVKIIGVTNSTVTFDSVAFYGATGAIPSAVSRTVFPLALPSLVVPTFYDLSFSKLLPFSSAVGSASDNWDLGSSVQVLLDSNFGVGITVSTSRTGLARADVFAVSVDVFFRTSNPAFVPPLSTCPPVQAHDADLPQRSLACPPVAQAQCSVSPAQRYTVTATNCQSQPAPVSSAAVLIASGSVNGTCPVGQV